MPETDPDNNPFLFRHPLTRDAAYDLMPPSVRAARHLAAADDLQQLDAAALAGAWPEIATHLSLALRWSGGYTPAARPLAEREFAAQSHAAEWLARQYQHDAALAMLGHAAANPFAPLDGLLELRLAAIRIAEGGGRFPAAVQHAEAADALLTVHPALASATKRAWVEVAAGTALARVGRVADAERRLDAAAAIAAAAGDRAMQARAAGTRATIRMQTERLTAAEADFHTALALAQAVGDRALESQISSNHSLLLQLQQRWPEAIAANERAAALNAGANPRLNGVILGNLAILLEETGRFDEAVARYREGLSVSRAIGDLNNTATVQMNYADILRARGQLVESERAFGEALLANRATGNRRNEAVCLFLHAKLLRQTGRTPEAERFLRTSIDRMRELQDPRNEAHSLRELASLLREVGGSATAAAEADARADLLLPKPPVLPAVK